MANLVLAPSSDAQWRLRDRLTSWRSSYYPAYNYPAYSYWDGYPAYDYSSPTYNYPYRYAGQGDYLRYSHPTYTYNFYYQPPSRQEAIAPNASPAATPETAPPAFSAPVPRPVVPASTVANNVLPAPSSEESRQEVAPKNTASLEVRAPLDAQIWVQGKLMASQGTENRFVSPPLEPGRNYRYEIRAQWREGSRDVTQTRAVTIRSGDVTIVDFTR